jgi:uncharacterized protein
MKFLAFTDLHEDKDSRKALVNRASKDDIDFVVCAGDISTFGRGLKIVLADFNKIGKKIYVIPGNHEENLNLPDALQSFSNCINLHLRAITIGDYLFLGYGGGGFSAEDPDFRKLAREWYGSYKDKKIVLVTHAPPFNTKIDVIDKNHVGSIDYRKFIERIKPKVVVCGHLHETAGLTDTIGNTKIVNPGWEGMVIELK